MRSVPFIRPEPNFGNLVVGAPVSASDWRELGNLANFVRGKGAQLVPSCNPEYTIASGATATFHFRVKTRAVAVARIWVLTLRYTTGTGSTSATVRAPASTGTALEYAVLGGGRRMPPIVYSELIGSPSATEAEISIDITAANGSVVVEQIACYEQDRPSLTSGETSVDLETLLRAQPIRSDVGWGEVASLAVSATSDARRVGIFHMATSDGAPWTKAGTGYTSLVTLGCPVLGPKDLTTSTTASVKWSAYAKITGGTGHVKLVTSHSTVNDVANVTSGTFAWTATRSISIDCDDLSTDDGLPSATWDELTPSIEGAGGQTISVASVCIWYDG